MRVAIAAVGCAALAYVFCCQNAGAVATTGTAIKEAAAAGSFPRDANAVSPVLLARPIASVIGSWSSVPMSAGTIGFRARLSLGLFCWTRSEG